MVLLVRIAEHTATGVVPFRLSDGDLMTDNVSCEKAIEYDDGGYYDYYRSDLSVDRYGD